MLFSYLTMYIIFFLFSLIFFLLKEKSCVLISGFNFLTKEQQEKYDKYKLSKHYAIMFLNFSLIFLIGGLLSYIFSDYFLWITVVIFILYLLKNVSLDLSCFDKFLIK